MHPTMAVPSVNFWIRVVTEVRGLQGEEKRGHHHALGCSGAADHSVRHSVLQADVLGPVDEVAADPSNQAEVYSHLVQFVLKLKGLYSIEKKHWRRT